MAIYISGIKVNSIEVSLKNKPQSLIDASPKGTVPVVVTCTGEVIEQSRDIMFWALQQSDPENWLLQNKMHIHQQMAKLVDTCDIQFKPLLDRYKYYDRYPEQPQEAYRKQAEVFLLELNSKLSEHAFLVDESMRFADVAIFPFIRQFAGVDKIWFANSPYKNLQRWLERCVSSNLFIAIMESQPN